MLNYTDSEQCNNQYGKTIVCKNIIMGEDITSDASFDSRNPSDLRDIVGQVYQASDDIIKNAVDAANQQKKLWKNTPAPVRAQVIGKLGELLTEHKETLSYLVTREIGKTLKEARGEVQEAIDTCHFFQSEGRRLYGQTVPSEMRNKELYTYRRPYGVVAIITPSNFPIAVASWKFIPALLAGNTVVWKTPPEAPAIAYVFAKLCSLAGLPKGVLNVIHGNGEVGQKLLDYVDAGKIDKVSFTGSTRVGKIVGEICGRNLHNPSLELGGKNPLIIMEDANLDLAIEGALWSSFGTAGQRCTSAGNIIVHHSIEQEFTQRFLEKVKQIHIGNPLLDETALYGPMIEEHYMTHFFEHFEQAKENNGPTLAYGQQRITQDNKPHTFKHDPQQGFYVWPTVWTDVKIKHWIAQNEVFGPTVGILSVKDINEAIDVANGTAYGLSSAIYTNNRMYAYQFKNEIEAGMSSINNSTTGAEAHLPFGGRKSSGNGTRESGIWVIDAYTEWHAVNDEMSGKLQLAQMDTEGLDQTQNSQLDLNDIMP
ncbi:aldehyde dehydrogenase family protein [bacterium]|nr:aldehyde dehydrogenase family protein [bacterium]